MNKSIIKMILLVLMISSVFIIFNIENNNVKASYTNKKSMYMWETTNIDFFQYDKLTKDLDIGKIYAYVGTDNLNTRIGYDQELLFSYNKANDIDTYVVYDENYDDQQTNLNRIKSFIGEINNYNNNSEHKIKGITIDSEFHTLDNFRNMSNEEQVAVFNSYVNAMKEAYVYAQNFGLEFVVCIPVWLDRLDINILDSLIKEGCDYVQLMNYTKSNMIESIQEEVEIAKKYNKKIENIAELQAPGNHGVTNEISFYNDGIELCNNKFIEIDNYYNYSFLTFSYHYYKPLIDMMEIDNNNRYNIKLKAKNEEGQNINLNQVILEENENKLYPIYIFDKENNDFIIYFYGLEYNKKYKLITEDINYEPLEEKEILYGNDNEKIKNDEIICKLKITTEQSKENESSEVVTKEDNLLDNSKEINLNNLTVSESATIEIPDEIVKSYADEVVISNAEIILYKMDSSDDYNEPENNVKVDTYSNNKNDKEKKTKKNTKINEEDKEEKLEEQSDYKLSLIIVLCLISISIFIVIKNIINNNF
ncbi:MAG: hypothetical protein E7158_01635 [Firmicutes bacterium]|nr:hypothetical protein [Bacillota bacterium]